MFTGAGYEKSILYTLSCARWCGGSYVSTQRVEDLGCRTGKTDIIIDYLGMKIGVEVKAGLKYFSKCSLQYIDHKWVLGKTGGFSPLFEAEVPKDLWNGEYPSNTNDIQSLRKYTISIPIRCTFVSDLYAHKGCQYIQIKNYGLYHLGEDICGFGVDRFEIPQELEFSMIGENGKFNPVVRPVIVNSSCTFKSRFSLDAVDKLPCNMLYDKQMALVLEGSKNPNKQEISQLPIGGQAYMNPQIPVYPYAYVNPYIYANQQPYMGMYVNMQGYGGPYMYANQWAYGGMAGRY